MSAQNARPHDRRYRGYVTEDATAPAVCEVDAYVGGYDEVAVVAEKVADLLLRAAEDVTGVEVRTDVVLVPRDEPGQVKTMPASPSAYQRSLELLQQGSLRSYEIISERDGVPEGLVGRLEIDFASQEWPGASDRIFFAISRSDLEHGGRPMAEEFVTLGASAATALRAVTGYLTRGYADMESPLELKTGRYWLDALSEARRTLRGCYWGNLLSDEHIKILGGRETILKRAPGSVVDLSEQSHELLLVQATDRPLQAGAADIMTLARYLEPLLPALGDDEPTSPRPPSLGVAITSVERYLGFKSEDYDDERREDMGPVWIGAGTEIAEQRGWMYRGQARDLADELGLPFREA
jgi:hypothetical protein